MNGIGRTEKIGPTTMIVAELSANHGGKLEVAKRTIEAMAEAGADAVKLQTYTPDTITLDSNRKEFTAATAGTIWEGRTLYDLYEDAFTPWEWHHELKNVAEDLGLLFFSTPFDVTAVDFLEELGVPIHKIASFEITDTPLIEYTASKGKPMVLSTGVADAGDIQLAVDACRQAGVTDITLLQCTSSYPAPVELANLRMIPNMRETFGAKVGLSDHTEGSAVPVGAVALGAVMVEKHFILERSLGGPDAAFSMEPEEFRNMVEQVRLVERALGNVDYSLTEPKAKSRKLARSLFVAENISKGETLTRENVRSVRPADGLHPRHLPEILGRRAGRGLCKGEPLRWELLEEED